MKWQTVLKLGVGLVALVMGLVFASRFGVDPGLRSSVLIGKPMPALTLDRLEGGPPVALSSLAGKVSVINFWASWCFPCQEETPLLLSAARQYAGVQFLGVVFQNRPADAIDFLDRFGRGYPHLVDPDSRAAIGFGVFGIPETFFVDAEGIIVAKITGPLTAESLTSTLDAVLLGEAPGERTLGTVQQQE